MKKYSVSTKNYLIFTREVEVEGSTVEEAKNAAKEEVIKFLEERNLVAPSPFFKRSVYVASIDEKKWNGEQFRTEVLDIEEV